MFLLIAEKSDNQETITAGKSEANPAKLKVALLPAPQVDGSASSKVSMMTTVPNTKEPFTALKERSTKYNSHTANTNNLLTI